MSNNTPTLTLWQRIRVLFTGKLPENVTRADTNQADNKPAQPANEETAPNSSSSAESAVHLLSLLQKHGRLVDFVFEDIDQYSDAEIGGGARIIHEGCRKVFNDYLSIVPLRPEQEESEITLEQPVNPAEIKISGETGDQTEQIKRALLLHKGWQISAINLPEFMHRHSRHVIAPAEVEAR